MDFFVDSSQQHTFDSPCLYYRQVRAKALGDESAVKGAIEFILQNFDDCMAAAKSQDNSECVGANVAEDEDDASGDDASVPACLEDDDSPAVDLLVALAKR